MSTSASERDRTAVALLHFGEPETTDRETVVDYLARIFQANADLEDHASETAARERSRELAERRAPRLIEEYEEIGGSPLHGQAMDRARALEGTLEDRGYGATTVAVGMQFTEPLIEEVATSLAERDVERVVGLPMYPLCGPSTTVAALDDLEHSMAEIDGWDPELAAITGWHRHPAYTRTRVDAIQETAAGADVDLSDPETTLLFSAHGTPVRYLEAGSRYVEYVEEYCETVARILGVSGYDLGYQNHENRDLDWTEPDVEDLIADLDAERVVVDPTSFVHEQSETLAELDHDLAQLAAEQGIDFHRVPVPHDDPRLLALFVALLEPFLSGFDPGYHQLRQCECRPVEGTYCLNASR